MVLRFSPPIAFSDACRTARASCAEALPASPITTTTIKNLFTISPPVRLAVCHGPIIAATRDHEGADSAHHEGHEDTQENRDDDDEVGVPWTRVGSGRMYVRTGARSEYHAGGGRSALRRRRECQAGRLQRYAGPAGTPTDREVRPRQW